MKDGQDELDSIHCAGAYQSRLPNGPLLLDFQMPRVDGVEVLRLLKAGPKAHELPVIMLTTTDDPREAKRGYEPGARVASPSRSPTTPSPRRRAVSACSSRS